MNVKECRYIIREYKLPWIFYRGLYEAKLFILKKCHSTERLFEKKVKIRRVDLLDFDTKAIRTFLLTLNIEKKQSIIDDADLAIKGKILGFSSILLDYQFPIRWNLNPLTGATIPASLKWYEISDFHPARGDIKAIWEISRFSHFYLFVRAYLITEDKKYYQAFSMQLKDWLDKNPYGYGANYKCGQECSLRMINALVTYTVFKKCGVTVTADLENIKELIRRCYKKVLSNFFYAHKCIKNNHTLSELCGMIAGAWCCGDSHRLKKAYRMLNKEVDSQFLPDGGYRQYSFTYQRLALQLMEFILMISPETGYGLESRCKEKLQNSAMLLYQVQNSDGDVPNYGSNDGALIFPLHSCGYRDFRPVIGGLLAGLQYGNVYQNGDYDEEQIWFFGEKKNSENSADTEKKLKQTSSTFNNSGYYIIRRSDGMAMIYLQNFETRPAHMDQLHIDVWHRGVNILCDCGTFSYADKEGQALSMTGAHNTIKVFHKEQMKKKGPFFIYGWTEKENCTFSEESFKGIMNSKNGYKHIREIEIKEYGYDVYDKVVGASQYQVLFHTPCKVQVRENKILLYGRNNQLAYIRADNADIEINKSIRSLYYLKTEVITEIILTPHTQENKIQIILKREKES